MIRQVVIEGIDGSGKTTIAKELASLLSAEGLTTLTFAPYRLAEERIGADIYPMWGSPATAKAAIGVLRQVFHDCQKQAEDETADVVIYDRHWMTAFTEIATSPELRATWGDMFVPAALLRVEPSIASARQANDEAAEWSDIDSQIQYATRYEDIAAQNFHQMLGIYRSGDDVTPQIVARAIESDLYFQR